MGIGKIILAAITVIVGIGIISSQFYQDDVNTEPEIEISKIPEPEPKFTEPEIETTPEPKIIEETTITEPSRTFPKEVQCTGNARCISDFVTRIIDGDTIVVGDKSIRFALVNTPEFGDSDYTQAKNFVETICPIGSKVLVDEDDGQTQGSYGRIIGKIYCNNLNLNEEVLEVGHAVILSQFCEVSEFAQEPWAKKHGCFEKISNEQSQSSKEIQNCDPSYPDFCIPSPPPDLNCKDIPQKRFTVLQPDPHRFDGDKDGIGCES